jgi:Zn-dependent peptidase ImmA (M78 family)
MNTFFSEKLPDKIVESIRQFIYTKMEELRNGGAFYNQVIREDILPLLDSQCTIIYYPSDDVEEDNNGFHKTYRYRGENRHFVYINTSQDIEKQIFTAAHELGHVWKVDEHLKKELGISIDDDMDEHIMNRFAAELLMPKELFCSFFEKTFDDKVKGGSLTVELLIQIITIIMNEFYVPYKSVVGRLYELGYMKEYSARVLWNGMPQLTREDIINYSKKYSREQGFTRLYSPDNKKHIAGLKEALDTARMKSAAPEQWLLEFYSRFELEASDAEDSLKTEITITNDEETKDNVGKSCN